jgi:integron integrase
MGQERPEFVGRFLEAVVVKCRQHGLSSSITERHRKCCEHFVVWTKGDGDWLKPSFVSRSRIDQYFSHLADTLRLALSHQLFAVGALEFVYAQVLNRPLVLNAEAELMQRLSDKIDQLGHSDKTNKTYSYHVLDFFRFHKIQPWQTTHRMFLTRDCVEAYLTFLAVKRNVSETTQNCAMHAILYLAKNVFGIEIQGIDALRAKRPQTLPQIISQQQVAMLLQAFADDGDDQNLLLSMLGYGCGMRVSESCGLRVQDCSFDRRQIIIRCAKGLVDRVVPLPELLVPLLKAQIEKARTILERDIRAGECRIPLPNAFARKSREAEKQFCWMWVFPSHKLSADPKTGRLGRWHINEANVNRHVSHKARGMNLPVRMHYHIWRHCFATHYLDAGGNIRKLQTMMGHKNLDTTMRYTHVALMGVSAELSPLDMLQQFVARATTIAIEKRSDTVRFPIRQNAG